MEINIYIHSICLQTFLTLEMPYAHRFMCNFYNYNRNLCTEVHRHVNYINITNTIPSPKLLKREMHHDSPTCKHA